MRAVEMLALLRLARIAKRWVEREAEPSRAADDAARAHEDYRECLKLLAAVAEMEAQRSGKA